MIKVNYHKWDEVNDKDLFYAIIVSRFKNKWVLSKHKERSTWEIPGGHREKGETIDFAASRELQEETGAREFKLMPICPYSVTIENVTTFGGLFFAEIYELGELPDLEIGEINFFDLLPDNLNYVEIQPHLFDKVVKYIGD